MNVLDLTCYDTGCLLEVHELSMEDEGDPKMGERLLEYNLAAHKEHDLDVLSIVIYLRSDGEVPQSPLLWKIPNGKETLRFHYLVMEMAKLPTEELRHEGLIGLLPLLLLTKDGATYAVVNEVIAGLQAAEKYDLLPVTELLASLVLKDEANQEWIKRRFAMLQDALRETPAYQRILQEGREKGLEKGREVLQQQLQRHREALLDMMLKRFPLLALRARDYAKTVDDPDKLFRLIIDMASASTTEEAERILQAFVEDGKKTN